MKANKKSLAFTHPLLGYTAVGAPPILLTALPPRPTAWVAAVIHQLMKPSVQGSSAEEAHALVCDLVKECVAQGLPTECTVVARDEVDVGRAQELAAVLGASCRVRPHFP